MSRPNTSIFQRKFYPQINSLSLSTSLQLMSMIGHGLVSFFQLKEWFLHFWISFFRWWYDASIAFFDAAVYFLYDLSPITVTIREERRSFLHFITRLCAVLGGTFALTGQSHLFPLICFSSACTCRSRHYLVMIWLYVNGGNSLNVL